VTSLLPDVDAFQLSEFMEQKNEKNGTILASKLLDYLLLSNLRLWVQRQQRKAWNSVCVPLHTQEIHWVHSR
jgi:hypothetical protein